MSQRCCYCLLSCHHLLCFLPAASRFGVAGSFRAALQEADSAVDRLHDAEIATGISLFPKWAGEHLFPILSWEL